MIKDYYKILGLDRTASGEEIKKAYHSLVRIHHPDKNPNSSKAIEKFNEINEAYYHLGDLDKRLEYSVLLHRQDEIKEEAKQKYYKLKKKQNAKKTDSK